MAREILTLSEILAGRGKVCPLAMLVQPGLNLAG